MRGGREVFDSFLAGFQPGNEAVDGISPCLQTGHFVVFDQYFSYLFNEGAIGLVYSFIASLADPEGGELADTADHCFVLIALVGF